MISPIKDRHEENHIGLLRGEIKTISGPDNRVRLQEGRVKLITIRSYRLEGIFRLYRVDSS